MRYIFLSVVLFCIGQFAQAENCDLNTFRQKFCISHIPQHPSLDELKHLNCDDLAKFPVSDYQLRDAFQISPRWFQLRLCSVDKIIVHPTFPDDSFQSWSYPPDSHVIGIDKAFIENGTSMGNWSRHDLGGMMAVIPIVKTWNFHYLSGQSEDLIVKLATSENSYLQTKFKFARYADSVINYK